MGCYRNGRPRKGGCGQTRGPRICMVVRGYVTLLPVSICKIYNSHHAHTKKNILIGNCSVLELKRGVEYSGACL